MNPFEANHGTHGRSRRQYIPPTNDKKFLFKFPAEVPPQRRTGRENLEEEEASGSMCSSPTIPGAETDETSSCGAEKVAPALCSRCTSSPQHAGTASARSSLGRQIRAGDGGSGREAVNPGGGTSLPASRRWRWMPRPSALSEADEVR